MSEQELRHIAGSLRAFLEFERKFYAEHPPSHRTRAARSRESVQVNSVSTLVHQRLALGRAYQKWLETPDGQLAVKQRRQRRAFIVAGTTRLESNVSKAETERLARGWHFALQQDL